MKTKNTPQYGCSNLRGIVVEAQGAKTTSVMRTLVRTVFIASMLLILLKNAYAQHKATLGILNIDTKGVLHDPAAMSNMVRLELDKTNVYSVIDKYDQTDIIEKNEVNIANCYGKSCVVNVGELLHAGKMVTGSVERLGEKIIITLRLIDVKSATVEKTDATEYLNLQPEIQRMIRISVKNLLGIENDPTEVNSLVHYEVPVVSPKSKIKASGPRMGMAYIAGDNGRRLQASDEGGLDLLPLLTQIGYQYEVQYLSAGNFQALIEFLGIITGMDQSIFRPSLSFLNGFRSTKTGWEVAFGPVFSFGKGKDGFFEDYVPNNGIKGNTGDWHSETIYDESTGTITTYKDNDVYVDKNGKSHNVTIITRLDDRGTPKLNSSWIWAIGKTFQSGYLNIPVNVYIAPSKSGWFIGASFGFNLNKQPKR
ncbi:MAG: hypothetical protein FVQ77_07660 [Cytophagales bacterium]|nr:hypothetical protein [Cytophagales bacterium]